MPKFRIVSWLGFFVLLFGATGLRAEEPISVGLTERMSEERNRILTYIQSELQPSLIERDTQRLRRNVMRLGSYRASWSQEAADFLLANPALAEWFLYDYARVQNPHLNREIISVLEKFPSFQEPLGPFAFAVDLTVNSDGKKALLPLFERVGSRHPQVLPTYLELVRSEWGRDLPLEEVLFFESQLCSATGIGSPLAQDAPGDRDKIWVKILKAKLKNCQRFL
jgi:hypothetical protein